MTPKLNDQLVKKYSKIFPKHFCFECGDGWYDLIDALCSSMQYYLNNNMVYRYSWWKTALSRYAALPFYDFLSDFLPPQSAILKRTNRFTYWLGNPSSSINIEQVQALQVKEKFGGLRFYYSGGDDEIAGMVRFAERMSHQICEICGGKGKLSLRGGWYATLCQRCRKNKRFTVVKSTTR